MKKRIVFIPTGLHVREAQDPQEEESRVIEGCAIVFNRETILWEDGDYRECEVIAPSCITPEFLREQDIKMNLLHERGTSLARYRNGEGSLMLDLREDGLYFSFEAPRCDLGDRVLALVKNGTYTGCSFEFWPQDYEIEERADGSLLITHKAFRSVTALTIAMDPAYGDTTVSAREELASRRRKPAEEEAQTHREQTVRSQRARYCKTLLTL